MIVDLQTGFLWLRSLEWNMVVFMIFDFQLIAYMDIYWLEVNTLTGIKLCKLLTVIKNIKNQTLLKPTYAL